MEWAEDDAWLELEALRPEHFLRMMFEISLSKKPLQGRHYREGVIRLRYQPIINLLPVVLTGSRLLNKGTQEISQRSPWSLASSVLCFGLGLNCVLKVSFPLPSAALLPFGSTAVLPYNTHDIGQALPCLICDYIPSTLGLMSSS